MNPLEMSRRLDEVWKQFSIAEQREFEQRYGRWEDLGASERHSYLGSYVSSIKGKERAKAEEELHARRMEPMVKALQGFGEMLDKHTTEIYRRLDEIGQATKQSGAEMRSLEARMGERALPSRILPTLPSDSHSQIQQQPTVIVTTPVRMNCQYSKDGPKDCIIVQQRPNGTYGHCTVGEQARSRQIAPLFLTSALDQTGCPSNRVIRVCEYLENEWVKL